jgi:Zn-dependent metalloprotease
MTCQCHIIPDDILDGLSQDDSFSDAERNNFANTAAVSRAFRRFRGHAAEFTAATTDRSLVPSAAAPSPAITVANCHQTQTLPGSPIANPGASADATVKRAFVETTAVAQFYQTVFGRNSVDGAGMTLASSVHYGVKFNNAFWNGLRMTYGDGDGNIFIDFTGGNDVIAHELTHGVTQHSLQLAYADEAGGLNESISDVFGSMFRQWQAGQDVNSADWLIGKDIMGPGAQARGFTCLRDMSSPGAARCLAPQPFKFSDYRPGMDPHYSSGIPNLAFYNAAKAIGGKSWERTGQIWYTALTGSGPTPNMGMKAFADRTRQVAASKYPGDASVARAVDAGWVSVGL